MEYAIKTPNEKRFNKVVNLAKKLGYDWIWGDRCMDYFPDVEIIILDNKDKSITWANLYSLDGATTSFRKKISYKQLKTLVEVKL